MIAKLTGLLDSAGLDSLIVDVNGVGYQVFVSTRTLSQLPNQGERLSVLTETVIRNEQPFLYGFTTRAEQEWFRTLMSVQGVGAKVALAIQSALSSDELQRAIALQDKASICRADGVGPKLGGRIVAELKDKVGYASLATPSQGASITPINNAMGDAISALQNLGYRRPDAIEAIAQASRDEGAQAGVDLLIKVALKHLSRGAAVHE